MGSDTFFLDQQAPDSCLFLELGSAKHKQWVGTLVQPLYWMSRRRVRRQTAAGSLAHMEDLGQSGLPSFSVPSSALARLCAPRLSLLSPALTIRTWWVFSHPISFFGPMGLIIPPGPAAYPVSLLVGAVPLSGSRSCHHLSLCPLSPTPSGPGLLCCAGEFQRGMEESRVRFVGHS